MEIARQSASHEKNGGRTIFLAGPGVRAAGTVLVWSVAFVPSEEGCRGRYGEPATMNPERTVRTLGWAVILNRLPPWLRRNSQ